MRQMMSVIRNEIIDHKENRIFQKKRQKLMNKTERQIKEQTTRVCESFSVNRDIKGLL